MNRWKCSIYLFSAHFVPKTGSHFSECALVCNRQAEHIALKGIFAAPDGADSLDHTSLANEYFIGQFYQAHIGSGGW